MSVAASQLHLSVHTNLHITMGVLACMCREAELVYARS